ncbi:acyltransferase domain-containing protein [Ruania zhangjianzhongii]|uniref:acyltransferase domain-containing protein n=1 Tax=Ruania zhangjianzhongii TaxID=2603206 RepID=UPI00143DD8A4|nr:acyltransferase domain-containing protein [Ruania zhangjianzhongii]
MTRALTVDQVRERLSSPDLPETLVLLGFADQDAYDALALVARTRSDDAALARIAELTGAVRDRIGDLLGEIPGSVWARDGDWAGEPMLAICTLLATVPEVRTYHRGRGIADAISWRSLSDLGQQIAVHRLTFGEFGVHTHDWLLNAWTGGLYWLGRLQFTIEQADGGILASVHIPRAGSFAPELVDASLARAPDFFARHFPELRLLGLHCASWLLDPQLAEVLPQSSTIADFGRRWRLTEELRPGDADVMFFVFSRRGTHRDGSDIDLDSLPQDSSLQRAVLAKLRSGGHWHCRVGHLPLPDGGAHPGGDLTSASGSDPEGLVRVFHEVYRVPVRTAAPHADSDRIPMRMALIAEELAELVGAVYGTPAQAVMDDAYTRAASLDDGTRDVVETADAIGDLVYVLYGMALECGIPLAEVLAEIQSSNLSKLGADGEPILREDGKVLKGPGYHRPDVAGVLRAHGWDG